MESPVALYIPATAFVVLTQDEIHGLDHGLFLQAWRLQSDHLALLSGE